jgi:hypothetical protein
MLNDVRHPKFDELLIFCSGLLFLFVSPFSLRVRNHHVSNKKGKKHS